MTIQQKIADIFSIFHDGTIESWSGDKNKLTLKIECQYLAERISPEYIYFYIDIIEITTIELDTYTENVENEKPTIIKEIDKIFNEEIDIYYAEIENQFVKINCWQVNETLGYVANQLRINCNSVDVFNQNKESITVSDLAKISDDYWTDFHNIAEQENNNILKENFENAIKDVELLNPKKQKKDIVVWVIKTILYTTIYIIFWKYVWVRYTLFLVIPLSLFTLFSCTLLPYIMRKKVENARKIITN